MFRFLAPAGTPVRISEILHAVTRANFSRDPAESSTGVLREDLGMEEVFCLSSGRGALTLALKALQRLRPDASIVAVPAYTCYSVAAAIVRAGLKMYFMDVDPQTLDTDIKSLNSIESKDLLCILTANICGLPSNLDALRAFTRESKVYVIDDAAQAMGATRLSEPAGTNADVAIFSFGRGKPLAAIEGGVVATNNSEIAAALREEYAQLAFSSMRRELQISLQMLIYSIFLRPRLYWIPNSVPWLKLGVTEFEPEFETAKMSKVAGCLISKLISRLRELNNQRREKAKLIVEGLSSRRGFTIPGPGVASEPTYIRFPVLLQDEDSRNRALSSLLQAGYGASALYPTALSGIPGIAKYVSSSTSSCPQAEDISKRLLTLPTHSYVTKDDITNMLELVKGSNRCGRS